MKRKNVLLPASALCVCGLLAAACVQPAVRADRSDFYANGRFRSHVAVSAPLTLAGAGNFSAMVPSEVLLAPPSATFRFAVFGEGESGSVDRTAHMIASELPSPSWRWEKESLARTESLYYALVNAGGHRQVVQIFPVESSGDWFSSFWTLNGRAVPDFWLAKHWSATPYDDIRIVAEYREAAPVCMRDRLAAFVESKKNRDYAPLHGKALMPRCEQEVEEFSRRADAAVTFGDAQAASPALSESGSVTQAALPGGRPDMRKLVGVAELVRNFPDSR
ncbi:MAG: DUF4851 domain-containing protein [Desulfovibrio sp.]|nr:DUF4851 domain-containing protein [Desulfovibrio sp.]